MDNDFEDEVGSGDAIDKNNMKWLGPAGTSLARLDQVKTAVYSVGLLDARDLRVTSGSRLKGQRSNNQANDNKLQRKSAWGSSGSLSGLVEQRKKRPESAKVYTATRPSSGKKPRPHSAHNPTSLTSGKKPRPLSAHDPTRPPSFPTYTTGLKDRIDSGHVKPFIAVKGAHYEPGERPANVGPYQQNSAAAAVFSVSQKEIDDSLQKVLDSQDATYGGSSGDEWRNIPPPPRTSPDLLQMIEEADDDSVIDEILYDSRRDAHPSTIKPPKHKQSRRPLPPKPKPPPPGPIHLSLPQMEDLPEEDAEIDTERLIGTADQHLSKGESQAVDLHQKEGFSYVHASVHINSPKGDRNLNVSSQNIESGFRENEQDDVNHRHQVFMERVGGYGNYSDVNAGDSHNVYDGDDNDFDWLSDIECPGDNVDGEDITERKNESAMLNTSHKSHKHGVTFDEGHNVTVDITPRDTDYVNMNQKNVHAQSNRSDLRHVKSKVDSGIKLWYKSPSHKADYVKQDAWKASTVTSKATRSNKESKVAMVSLQFSDESETEEEPRTKTKKKSRSNPDVETMMSRISISDDESELCTSQQDKSREKTPSYSFVGRGDSVNYYELIRQGKQSKDDTDPPPQQKITKNTIVLHNRQVIVQKNVHLLEPAPQKEAHASVRPPSGLSRPSSAQKVHGISASLDKSEEVHERPASHLQNSPTLKNATEKIVPKKTRPISAPTYKSHHHGIKPHRTAASKHRPVSAHTISNGYKPHMFCHNSSHVDLNMQPSAMEAKRANAAVQAMKDGKLFEKRTNSANCFAGRKAEPKNDKPQKVIEIFHRQDDFDIDSEDVQECKEIQDRLLEKGVPVSLETLTRALLPPAAQSNYGQDNYTNKLPTHQSGLLSKPKTWLPQEFEKLITAKKAVRLATESLLEQDREARRAAGLITSKKKKKGKKGKKGNRVSSA